jgi:uncharacterized membrane protein
LLALSTTCSRHMFGLVNMIIIIIITIINIQVGRFLRSSRYNLVIRVLFLTSFAETVFAEMAVAARWSVSCKACRKLNCKMAVSSIGEKETLLKGGLRC